jgi:RNA polymerase sigma-70 factor (ECF subfamily)
MTHKLSRNFQEIKDIKISSIAEKQEEEIHEIEEKLIDDEIFIKKTLELNPKDGCELLFRRYYKPLCNHAIRYVYSKEIAEDLVSDVFYKFWKNESYKNIRSSFRSYLFISVRNTSFTYLRSEFNVVERTEHSNLVASAENHNADSICIYEETLHRVKLLVDSMPPQCKKIFLLSRFESKGNKEIAKELNLSLKTIEAHMGKALGIMRKGLKDYIAFLIIYGCLQ